MHSGSANQGIEFDDMNTSYLMDKGDSEIKDRDYGILSGRYASIVNKADMQ